MIKIVFREKRRKRKALENTREETTDKMRTKRLAMKGREETLARSLYSFIKVCLSCGMTGRAYQTLMHYRRKGLRKQSLIKVKDVRLYNLLVQTYASSANMLKIKEILSMLKEDSIKPSVQTYAAVLESFGRLRKPEKERGKERFLFHKKMRSSLKDENLRFVQNEIDQLFFFFRSFP